MRVSLSVLYYTNGKILLYIHKICGQCIFYTTADKEESARILIWLEVLMAMLSFN